MSPIIRSIEMDRHGVPEFVTVKMTVEQLADLVLVVGKMSPPTGSTEALTEFYQFALSELFNRYWEGGIHSYRRDNDPE